MEEVLHQVLAGRLDVGETRRGSGQPVEVVERQRHSETARDRDEVDDSVGGTPERHKRRDCIFEGASRVRIRDGRRS